MKRILAWFLFSTQAYGALCVDWVTKLPIACSSGGSELHYYAAGTTQSGTPSIPFSTGVGTGCTAFTDTSAINGAIFGTCRFSATGKFIQDHFTLPSSVSAIAIDGVFRNSATSGNVVWAIQTGCTNTGGLIDPTFNTKQSITVASQGTTLFQNVFSNSTLTMTGCSAGYEFFWKLTLDAATTVAFGTVDLVSLRFSAGGTSVTPTPPSTLTWHGLTSSDWSGLTSTTWSTLTI